MADISIININGTDEYNIKDSSARTDINTINSTLIEAQSEDKGKVWKTDPVTGIPSWRTGEGGSGDYEDLSNLPTINNNTIIGDLTSADLGLQDELEAGYNISIEGNVISAVGSSFPSGGLKGMFLTKFSNLDEDVIWDYIPVMQGATNYSNGEEGLAPKPYAGDVGKALFADGQYHTIYSAASGSTILAVTTDSALFGRTVTITDGVHSATATMGNDGECYFTDISMFGNVLISCTDAEGNEAKASLNLTYFGTYQCNLTLNFATLRFTSSDLDLVGMEVAVWHNGIQIGTTSLRLMGGELVADFIVEELGDYTAILTPSSKGLGRANVTVTALRQVYGVPLMLYHMYAYQIDENNSDPATCVTEFNSPWGYENVNFTPAHMDFTNDVFEMGSWTGNEFFFPRPCLLGYDGTVITYLDKNDYTKDVDGNTVDISSASVNGNVMIEFPTVYFARWQSANKTYVCISNKKVSDDFDAYAHHDINGNVLPYIYIAAYDGSYDGTKLRSLSGKAAHNREQLTNGYIMSNTTRQQEVNFAKANNIGIASGHEGYYTWHKADRDLVVDLLTLIGMSTDSQTTFGRGRDTGGTPTSTGFVTTGSMNTRGMFWGENAGAAGVKVFGIENFWANIAKACAGWINANGTQKVKMTYGTEDGSSATGFNFDGTGYATISGATPSGTSGGYINKWKKTMYGLIPYQASGSQTTYMCDGLWFTNGQNRYALVGGSSSDILRCGAVCSNLSDASSTAWWSYGAALTCK